jgi:hypothetical protein
MFNKIIRFFECIGVSHAASQLSQHGHKKEAMALLDLYRNGGLYRG